MSVLGIYLGCVLGGAAATLICVGAVWIIQTAEDRASGRARKRARRTFRGDWTNDDHAAGPTRNGVNQ